MGDACSRPPIIIRFQDLHAGDIKGVVGEIAPYHKGLALSLLWFLRALHFFGLSLAFLFVVCVMVPAIKFFGVLFANPKHIID